MTRTVLGLLAVAAWLGLAVFFALGPLAGKGAAILLTIACPFGAAITAFAVFGGKARAGTAADDIDPTPGAQDQTGHLPGSGRPRRRL
jgi:hypothetical protein